MKHTTITDRELKALLAILRCGEGAYGPAIRDELHERTGENLSLSALYSVLDRLDDKGLIDSRMGEATPERGGKRKKFYRVNGSGQLAIQHATYAVDRLREGLDVPPLPQGGVAA